LTEFEESVKVILGQLHEFANFDSRMANGLVNKSIKLEGLQQQYAEENRIGNKRNAENLEVKIKSITNNITSAEEKLENQLIQLEKQQSKDDPIATIKLTIAKSALERLKQKSQTTPSVSDNKEPHRTSWNAGKYIRTLLENYVIDMNLRDNVANKNSKDTLVNLFTMIETKLKVKCDLDGSEHIEIDKLLETFVSSYRPPDYVPKSEYSSFYPAFRSFLNSLFVLFRNGAAHNFLEHFDNDRNNLQFLMMGDLLLSLIDSWVRKT
jgi:hypothetical protein